MSFETQPVGIWAVLGFKLGPSWGHVGTKNRKKSIPKSIKNLMLFKIDFGTDFDRFLDPTWSQVGIKIGSKIDVNFERRFFEKSCSRCSGGSIFQVWGVEVGSKNRSKIDQKMTSTWKGILASIFLRFWWIWEAKLGRKTEPRGSQRQ